MLEETTTGEATARPVPLPAPDALRAALPVPARAAATVAAGRRGLRDLLHGRDRTRLLVITGPCSLHDPASALDYATRLRRLTEPLAGELLVAMRTFFEKPRTRTGWKGLANDPDLDGRCDVARGLRATRGLLGEISALGIPCAAEILDPMTPAYVEDLLVWGGIGARTAESQVHRQLASGLPFPVGVKNGTDGRLDAACDALDAIAAPHRFAGLADDGSPAVLSTRGNPDRHVVLRGGQGGPNHARVAALAQRLAGDAPERPVLVDCSHGNSGKDPARQGTVCREVLADWRGGTRGLLGVMLESHLEAGRQPLGPERLRYGVSVTDACIGWNETADLLCEIAEAVKLAR